VAVTHVRVRRRELGELAQDEERPRGERRHVGLFEYRIFVVVPVVKACGVVVFLLDIWYRLIARLIRCGFCIRFILLMVVLSFVWLIRVWLIRVWLIRVWLIRIWLIRI
jgi:hypothetical protein